MTVLFLAIDGGNSKTDVVLGTADGRVLGFVRGPGSSPHNIGLADAMAVLDSLIRAVRARAGLPAATAVDLITVYLAGADLPVEVDRLHTAVSGMSWAATAVVDNDTFALMRAGSCLPDTIAVVCGAGINCVGRAADGRTARFPALGDLSGDWGGGHHLAERALWYAARGEDGRGTPTALSAAVAQHLGRPTVESVATGLHLGEIPMSAVHELSPVVFAVATTGDPVAGRLIQRQVDEILALHRVAAERLGIRFLPHALVFGGGVLRARHPLLHEPVLAGILAYSPLVDVTVLTDPPVVGAALLALDALGTAAAAEPTLRAALARTPDTVPPPPPQLTRPQLPVPAVPQSRTALDGHPILDGEPASRRR
jgi:N-acetylglucosamine kinase-like BadF-type ATPase